MRIQKILHAINRTVSQLIVLFTEALSLLYGLLHLEILHLEVLPATFGGWRMKSQGHIPGRGCVFLKEFSRLSLPYLALTLHLEKEMTPGPSLPVSPTPTLCIMLLCPGERWRGWLGFVRNSSGYYMSGKPTHS